MKTKRSIYKSVKLISVDDSLKVLEFENIRVPIKQSDKDTTKWEIDSFQIDHPILNGLSDFLFDSPEEARDVAIQMILNHKKAISVAPIDPVAIERLKYLLSFLEQEKRELKNHFHTINRQLDDLRGALHKLGLDNYFNEDLSKSESDKLIEDIIDFKLMGEEYPFFSEGKLYDLVGKDDARSILAMFRSLIALVNPDKATKI